MTLMGDRSGSAHVRRGNHTHKEPHSSLLARLGGSSQSLRCRLWLFSAWSLPHRFLSNLNFRSLVAWIVLIGVFSSLIVLNGFADSPFDDLTPDEYTFTGRRGTTYTATWDRTTNEFTIWSPDGTFPWDWTAFVNANGAIALAGHPDVADTFRFSDSSSLAGVGAGDVMRVKAWNIISLAHLTKIGLIVGSGPTAQRAWLSDGTISCYTLAPYYVGYRVSLLGRTITVRISHLAIGALEAAGLIEVAIDDPTDAYVLLASDLEPRTRYQQAVEYRGINDTTLEFDAEHTAIRGRGGDGTSVYLYADVPLFGWSASNRSFNDYLAADTLDGQVATGTGDGRVALKVTARPVQRFYIANFILPDDERRDPTALWESLRDERLNALRQMPTLDAPDLPAFEFVLGLSNLLGRTLPIDITDSRDKLE